MSDGTVRGVVVRDEGSSLVVDVEGKEISCVVRKSLRLSAGKRRKAVVVGDRVVVERSGDGGAIREVEERRSLLSRPEPGDARREQILVANVDAVLIVAAARDPDFAPGLVDRFLVAAEAREFLIALAINKCDLGLEGEARQAVALYRSLGYPVLEASATAGTGLDAVRAFLAGHTTTMLGASGAGKSSLANALDPALRLRTGEVHSGSGQGMHTTSTVSLLRLPWGGYLVDTPGVREFGLWDLEPRDIGFQFRDFAAHLHDCRFNDCLHEAEPGCAVKAAVAAGSIARGRYDSYRRILAAVREDCRDLEL